MNLYLLENGLGTWYLIATDPTSAQMFLEEQLNNENYGLDKERKVITIKLLAHEVRPALKNKYFFSGGDSLLIVPNITEAKVD